MATTQSNPAVHKTVSILEYLAERKTAVSVKELGYSLNIPPASCYRMVNTLLERNWIREDPAGGLRIAFGFAYAARAYSTLEERMRETEPVLRDLSNRLKLSIKVSLREGYFATTVFRAEPSLPNAITSPIGSRIHLSIGSAAAVLLAEMPDSEIKVVLAGAPESSWKRQRPEDVWSRVRDCRARGYCYELGRNHPSVYAASIPLRLTDVDGVALTAVGWPEDFEEPGRDRIVEALRKTARSVEPG